MPGLTIVSFHLEQLLRAIELMPGVRHGWLVGDLTDTDISQILKLMEIANTKHSAEAMCRTHAQVAINHSREVNLGRSFINELDDLIQFLMKLFG